MDVLVLSPYPEKLAAILAATGDRAIAYDAALSSVASAPAAVAACEFAVSYGYRHIIRGEALNYWHDRLINLHISLLPWSRGADPNFWAAYDGTPTGVSIHFIDSGIDTGDLIAQAELPFRHDDTLASSYARLHREILELFAKTWPQIRDGQAPRQPQKGTGSVHRARDKEALMARLPLGWDTPVDEIAALARMRSPA